MKECELATHSHLVRMHRFALVGADASSARSILVFKQDEDKVSPSSTSHILVINTMIVVADHGT